MRATACIVCVEANPLERQMQLLTQFANERRVHLFTDAPVLELDLCLLWYFLFSFLSLSSLSLSLCILFGPLVSCLLKLMVKMNGQSNLVNE